MKNCFDTTSAREDILTRTILKKFQKGNWPDKGWNFYDKKGIRRRFDMKTSVRGRGYLFVDQTKWKGYIHSISLNASRVGARIDLI